MDRVFDILLYLDLFIAVPVFVLELIRFPAWVERIDLNKNIEGKPIGRYLENRFVLVELRIVLTVVAFAAGSIVFMLLGSFPREIGSPKFLLFLPILLMVAGTGIGGVFLGNWFYKTAKRSEIFREAASAHEIFVRSRSQLGMGIFICFYLSIVAAFPMMHLFFLLNWI